MQEIWGLLGVWGVVLAAVAVDAGALRAQRDLGERLARALDGERQQLACGRWQAFERNLRDAAALLERLGAGDGAYRDAAQAALAAAPAPGACGVARLHRQDNRRLPPDWPNWIVALGE